MNRIGLSKEFPYCIRDKEVYCSTLCRNGKWERCPADDNVKAFNNRAEAERYIERKNMSFVAEVIIPYREWNRSDD